METEVVNKLPQLATEVVDKPPQQRPITKEELLTKIPEKLSKDLPDDFFELINSKPAGYIVMFPDLNKLFATSLIKIPKTKEEAEAKEKEMEKEGLKLWAAKLIHPAEGGGIFTYLSKRKLPYRGVPHFAAVERLAFVKKAIPTIIKSLPIELMMIEYGFLFLFFRKKFEKKIMGIADNFLNFASNALGIFVMDDIRFCRCVQEVRKTIDEMIKRKGIEGREKGKIIRGKNVGSVVLEYDNAYRFRFQDFWGIANIKILAFGNKKEFLKEMARIFDEIIRRENVRLEKRASWKKKKTLVLFLLRIKKYRELFQEFCQIIDIEKLRFTDEDRCFIEQRSDYMMEGRLSPKMMPLWKEYLEMYEKELLETKSKERKKFAQNQIKTLNYHLNLYGNT